MQSKFKIGDKVIYNDGMTKPFTSTIIEIKYTGKYLYKLKDKNIFITDKFLSNDNSNN